LSRLPAALVRMSLLVSLLASGLLLSCGGGDKPDTPSGPPMPFSIDFVDLGGDEIPVKPNGSRQVVFALHDAVGQPLPGRTMQLLIVDGAKAAAGATLSIDRGVTDAAGQVPVQIIGGQPTNFVIRASALGAPDHDLKVRVTAQDSGPISVLPDLVGNDAFAGINVASVRVVLFENLGCAEVKRLTTPPPVNAVRTTPLGKEVFYGTVSTAGGHAIFGQGMDAAGLLVVEGCVDLSGLSVLAETMIRVVLPLAPVEPSAVGRFSAVSQFRFPAEPAPILQPLGNLRAVWHELDACDLDPGRLWLDCTVDALGPADANDPTDPLDCRPSAADEAVFDGRLTARRGLPVPTSKDGRCRQDFDGAGHASLEKQIAAMFAASPKVITDLRAISAEGNKLLDTFRIHSTLDVKPTSLPDRLQMDHSLNLLEVGIGSEMVKVNLPSLGAPSPSARFIGADVSRTDVTIARHGFTLRLGSAARMAFYDGALVKRGYPADPAKYIAMLFAAASYFDRGTTYKACPALSALVCPLVGGADGCVVAACEKGIAALGKSLADAFAALDGDDLDFFLEGSAPLLDRDGDGAADGIGWLLSSPGVWKALVRLKQEQFAISGFFAADRIVAPAAPSP
jgi:hypothetical protein